MEQPRQKPRAAPGWGGVRVFALGHSTRPLEELLAILRGHEVRTLVDIRTVPRSRHNPQFNADALGPALRATKIRYISIKELGGLRHGGDPRGPNGAWRNRSFLAYADHMQTEAFARGLKRLQAHPRR